MPSKSKQAPDALASLEALLTPARREYRSAVVSAREELRALAAPKRGDVDPEVGGPFSSSYLDTIKLAKMTPRQDHGEADTPRLESALGVMSDLLARGENLFRIEVPRGGDLYSLVHARLSEIGRAFAAARAASLAQAGMPSAEDEALSLAVFPFSRWSCAERALAPALSIHVRGEDLHADALAAFADGNLTLGFLVDGVCSPAPLVGLVRPGTYVSQTSAIEPGEKLPTNTPCFLALLPDATKTTASFLHTPVSGGASSEGIFARLVIDRLPEATPTTNLGAKSARQQQEELRQLAALAIEPIQRAPEVTTVPVTVAAGSGSSPSAAASTGDPVERLAAWLLTRRQE